MYKKTHVDFFVFHFMQLYVFPFMNSLVYVNLDQDIHEGKIKINEKKYVGIILEHYV